MPMFKEDVATILCMLEIEMPPSFFWCVDTPCGTSHWGAQCVQSSPHLVDVLHRMDEQGA
jgi:hypothetical protein